MCENQWPGAPMAGPAVRAAGAVLFGLVSVVLASVAHHAAGGCPGSRAAVLLGLGGAALVSALLGRAERDLVDLGACLVGTELALHLLFVQLPDLSAAETAAPGTTGTALMLVAHLLATIGAACWLRHGEGAVWSLLRVLAAALLTERVRLLLGQYRLDPVVPATPQPLALPSGLVIRAPQTWPAAIPDRRGPPGRTPVPLS